MPRNFVEASATKDVELLVTARVYQANRGVWEAIVGAGPQEPDQPGQRIGLLAPNDMTYLPAAFGLLAAGACFVPLASNLTPTEIAAIVREVQLNGCLSWPKAAPLPAASAPTRATAALSRL